jgi:hypothetical protein
MGRVSRCQYSRCRLEVEIVSGCMEVEGKWWFDQKTGNGYIVNVKVNFEYVRTSNFSPDSFVPSERG